MGNPVGVLWINIINNYRCVLVFSSFINLLLFASPLYMMQIYDRVLSSRSEITLLSLSIILVFVLLLSAAIDLMRSRILVRAGIRFTERISERLFDVVSEQERRNPRSGSVQHLRDADTVREFATGSGILAFCDAPWAPLFIVLCWFLHPFLGITALCGGIILFGLAVAGELATRSLVVEASSASMVSANEASASLRNAETVRALGMLGAMRERWLKLRDDVVSKQAIASDRAGTILAFSKFFRQFLQSAVLGIGAWLAIEQEISPGVMIAASILVGRALAPIEQAVANWKSFLAAREAYSRLKTLFESVGEVPRRPLLPDPKGHLTADNMTIIPPGSDKPTLTDVTFEVKPGEAVAVVGPSASGKSTLVRAVLGLWSAASGSIRMDGYTLDQWDPDILGRCLGYVPQDLELFSGTVAENIARLRDFDMEAVIAAATSAGLHDLIQRFPDGYNTKVGLGGLPLSGGQRQRIALARALYGRPALLVLDEANSNLDTAGEISLMTAIREAKENDAAVIFTTHKPNILQVADRILILSEGRVQLYGPRDKVLPVLMGRRSQPLSGNESGTEKRMAS